MLFSNGKRTFKFFNDFYNSQLHDAEDFFQSLHVQDKRILNLKASQMIALPEKRKETILRSLTDAIPELYVKKIIKKVLDAKDIKQARSLSFQLVEEYKTSIPSLPLPEVVWPS